MIKNLGLFVLLGASLLGCAATKAPYSATEKTTHRLELDTAQGAVICSGTAVNAYVILTAAHCLPEANESINIKINGRVAKVLKYAKDGNDHVMIKVDIAFGHAAKFAANPVAKGDVIHFFGNPGGEDQLFRTGHVSGWRPDGKAILDINAWTGDSGAAVFNEDGRIVGVMSAVLGQNIFKLGSMYPMAFTPEQYKDFGVK